MEQDSYFGRPEVSNSDLSALKDLLHPKPEFGDKQKAYAFGTLLDFMITEHDKVDYFNLSVQGQYADYPFTKEDFDLANRMKASFMKDEFSRIVYENAYFQHIAIKNLEINYLGFDFELPMRCKFDFYFPESWKMGGDIKSTAAETQSQFEAACEHFDYYRSRSLYMDLAGTDKDMLIGISKKNCKIFKIAINRGDALYEKGKAEYQELAFRYWMLFDGLKLTA